MVRRKGFGGKGDTPPRVFCGKRLQAIEKKGRECEKERQEISRGGKLLRGQGLTGES